MKSPRPACRLVALLGIGVCVFAVPALAQDCPELVGRWPYGPALSISVSGDCAYFTSGAGLMVADVSGPAPLKIGEVALPDLVRRVVVSGSHAYVADNEAGLRVVDVSTPSSPAEVGFVETPGLAWGVAVSDGHAYVAAGDDGLRVIDVTLPGWPIEVGFLETSGPAYDFAVSGNHAYVAGQFNC